MSKNTNACPKVFQNQAGRGCLVEGCLELPGVFPDIFDLRFSLGNEGKEGKNLSSQTWPGSPSVLLPDIRDHPTKAASKTTLTLFGICACGHGFRLGTVSNDRPLCFYLSLLFWGATMIHPHP